MGHIQQLAFALGPIEARPAAPARPRPAGRPGRSVATTQPLLPEVAPAATIEPVAAIAPEPPPPPAAAPPPAATETPLSDDASPVKGTLYVAIGFARGRRRGGWHRQTEQGFASRRLAEEHAARLLARGRADGVLLTRQDLSADMDAAAEPVILARFGELPAELAEV